MKAAQIKVGGLYKASVNGAIVTVRVDSISPSAIGGTTYRYTNVKTGRTSSCRSAAKFRSEVPRLMADSNGKIRTPEEAKIAEAEQRSDPPSCSVTAAPANHTLSETAPAKLTPVPSGLLASLRPQQDSSQHLVIEARAGTGKTTTLISSLQQLKGMTPRAGNGNPITPSDQQAAVWEEVCKSPRGSSVTFVAFNKSIATELQSRVPSGCDAMTMHSMGYKAVQSGLGRLRPSEWAVREIIGQVAGMDSRDLQKEKPVLVNAVDRLVSLCKMNLLDPSSENLDLLISHFDIDVDPNRNDIMSMTPQVLEACKDPKGQITFDDMIWLPIIRGLAVPKSDLLLVDESQDLNRCQQALAKKAGHRLIFCGDPKQAIYGFAGADSESMQRLERELLDTPRSCQHLPLTVTRRCGKAIVAEANKYVPDFQAHESNCDGEIRSMRYSFRKTDMGMVEVPWAETYMPHAGPGDMVLCRMNAPLVSNCFRFLREGRKANIQGRDVGKGLIKTVEKVCKGQTYTSIQALTGLLSEWYHLEEGKELAKRYPSETKLVGLQDRYDCLIAFTEDCRDANEVIRKIETIFTDDKNSPGIRLSSIHKAKGLEADNVFFLKPPTNFKRKEGKKEQTWELEQEDNLEYVAITRAIRTLTYCR